jgi:hypothetical protein
VIRCDLDMTTRRTLVRLALGHHNDKLCRQFAALEFEGLIAFDYSGNPWVTPAGLGVIRGWIAEPPIAWASFRRSQGRPRMGAGTRLGQTVADVLSVG